MDQVRQESMRTCAILFVLYVHYSHQWQAHLPLHLLNLSKLK